jgi:hypothetical protein
MRGFPGIIAPPTISTAINNASSILSPQQVNFVFADYIAFTKMQELLRCHADALLGEMQSY